MRMGIFTRTVTAMAMATITAALRLTLEDHCTNVQSLRWDTFRKPHDRCCCLESRISVWVQHFGWQVKK